MPTDGQRHLDSRLSSTGSGHERWFVRHPHDIEIRRGGHDYWVRGVRRHEAYLMGSAGLEAFLLLPLTIPYLMARDALIQRQRTWRVGVLRFQRDGGASPGALMYDEPLPEHADVAAAVARLAQYVEAGEFDEAPVPPVWERIRAGMRLYPKDGYPRGSRRLR